MKIYTKTGDNGTTSLFGGNRVPKYHIRIDSYGTVDELNAYIGLIRDQQIDTSHKEMMITIQKNLFAMGTVLATDPEKTILKNGEKRITIKTLSTEDIEILEREIDLMNENLPPMTHFILPGGHPSVSICHVARTVCRRAERLATALYEQEPFEKETLQYLNRLSDYLFVLSRKLAKELSAEEIPWIPQKNIK